MAEHWLRALNRTKLEPAPHGREHRDGTTSNRYPWADTCERCGTPTPRSMFGTLRPHRAKARLRIKHGQVHADALLCAR
jgi:hypothetical protein